MAKCRTKQTTEQLYRHVDDVWTETEAKAKKVYADMEEKIAAAKLEVKESNGAGKQEPTGSNRTPSSHCSNGNVGDKSAFGGEKQQGQQQQPDFDDNGKTLSGLYWRDFN